LAANQAESGRVRQSQAEAGRGKISVIFLSLLKMASAVVKSLLQQNLIKDAARPRNLYQLLALLPNDGLGARVCPNNWTLSSSSTSSSSANNANSKGASDNHNSNNRNTYYTITNVCLTPVISFYSAHIFIITTDYQLRIFLYRDIPKEWFVVNERCKVCPT
jgi:hypothetical protein